ncbi:MAG TPA: hypothetical protein PKC34_06340 [Pseudomonadales bacterium]|jgi:hypothetical protein|nr:hypothetical protein [Pseudomonadales bacterium]HMZ69966.1 hypothetical protein [Pseudomonadales bacterium]HNI65247.1 hypothetical protein [Pseudomonadales bacterium]HNL31916.1 hypothetical protein [Pseudomonadales bacterium]HNN36213.1 hypothetical protein [Pseudomonadales bacterium]
MRSVHPMVGDVAAPDMAPLPCIIDVEASGFGAGSYPIEIGFVLPTGRAHCYLLRPLPDWGHWDATAERIHRIDRATLLRHGRALPEVADALNHHLQGSKVYTDAWGQDMAWLALLFDSAGVKQRFVLESIRALLSDAQAAAWSGMKQQAMVELRLDRHRASHDARIIQLAYRKSRVL